MSSITSVRVNEPAINFLAANKLPFADTLRILNCPHSLEASEKLVVTSYANSNDDWLVNFHYVKGAHEDPVVGHVRGWVVLYEQGFQFSTKMRVKLVCRGMKVPKILQGGDLDPTGADVIKMVCKYGDTRLRIFSALGRTWISSHRSLDCSNDRWIENAATFGELLSTANLSGHFERVARGKVVSFTVPNSGVVDPSDGMMVWDPSDWSAVSYSSEVPENYLNVTFYDQSTGECWTRLSPQKFEECILRGNSGSLFEAFENSIRTGESFGFLSTAERQRYTAARTKFFELCHHYYTLRYVKRVYVRTNSHLHRFLKFLDECEHGRPITVDRVGELALDYDCADFSKLVTHGNAFLKA